MDSELMAARQALAARDARIAELEAALESVRDGIGEAIHTGFRKGMDGHGSAEIWRLINAIPPRAWKNYLAFVTDGLGVDAALTSTPSAALRRLRALEKCAETIRVEVFAREHSGEYPQCAAALAEWRAAREEK